MNRLQHNAAGILKAYKLYAIDTTILEKTFSSYPNKIEETSDIKSLSRDS